MAKRKAVRRARHVAKRLLRPVSKLLWRQPLDRPATLDLLEGYRLDVKQDADVTLPVLDPASGQRPTAFGRGRVSFEPEFVWKIETDAVVRSIRIAPSGTVLLNDRQLLNLDFDSLPGILDRPGKVDADLVELAIAPWSHTWSAYYDFLMFVVAKLCRIKDVLDEETWNRATICYASRGKSFEREYLGKLGLDHQAVVDTRMGTRLSAKEAVVSNIQHNWLPSPSSVAALRHHLLNGSPESAAGKRIYLSRGKTRRVANEREVLGILAMHGFETIEDRLRPVEEQIQLFRAASIIVAPHGSSLANLVWCTPGAQVVELFSASFTWAYYYYLSRVVGLGYNYLVDNSQKPAHWSNTQEDMVVDLRALERVVERIIERR